MRNDRWATREEIKAALAPSSSDATGPVLYYEHGQSWVCDSESHTLYLGATGTGKTRRGTLPLLLSMIEGGESAIVCDPKGELYSHCACNIPKEAKTYVYDFRDVCDGSLCWNPLSTIAFYLKSDNLRDRVKGADLLSSLAHALYPVHSSTDPFWVESARSLFEGLCGALIQVAEPEQIHLASVYRLLYDSESPSGPMVTLKQLMEQLSQDSPFCMDLYSYCKTVKDTRAGIYSTCLQGISKFIRNEALLRMCSHDDLKIHELDGNQQTFFFLILPDETPVYHALASDLCSQLTQHFVALAHERYGGRLPIRMNVIMEELGTMADAMPNLPMLLAAGRSRNIRCHLVLQNMGQLDHAFGQEAAQTIRDNAELVIAFRTSHYETLQELSQKCGVRQVSGSSFSSTEALITPSQLGAMETGQALVSLRGRLRFVTWLPDFEVLTGSGSWTPPKKLQRRHMSVEFFDLTAFNRKCQQEKEERARAEALTAHLKDTKFCDDDYDEFFDSLLYDTNTDGA